MCLHDSNDALYFPTGTENHLGVFHLGVFQMGWRYVCNASHRRKQAVLGSFLY